MIELLQKVKVLADISLCFYPSALVVKEVELHQQSLLNHCSLKQQSVLEQWFSIMSAHSPAYFFVDFAAATGRCGILCGAP